jgi:hypothetical protein
MSPLYQAIRTDRIRVVLLSVAMSLATLIGTVWLVLLALVAQTSYRLVALFLLLVLFSNLSAKLAQTWIDT